MAASVLQLYFNQVIGIPAVWVGAAIMVSLLADVLFDPLIGRWSDHLRSRWGRRHPFMYASALPAGIFFYLLWHPPKDLPPTGIMGLAIAMMLGVRLSVATYEISSTALSPELAPDYDQRTSLLAFRWFFAIGALAVITIVLYDSLPRPGRRQPAGRAEPRALRRVRDLGRGGDDRLHPDLHRRHPQPDPLSAPAAGDPDAAARGVQGDCRRHQPSGADRGDDIQHAGRHRRRHHHDTFQLLLPASVGPEVPGDRPPGGGRPAVVDHRHRRGAGDFPEVRQEKGDAGPPDRIGIHLHAPDRRSGSWASCRRTAHSFSTSCCSPMWW